MKIIALTAENVKKLVAVEIRPDGNLVQITGKNGQGKTSVLDSIWWALAGASSIQSAPIRTGEKKARIRLDLGEIVVTRTFIAKDGGESTTSIAVENADGAKFPSPQKMLDDLFGELAMDPLGFLRSKPKEQFDTLKRFVPGVDFDKIAVAQTVDYENRTTVNRKAKEKRAAAAALVVPPEVPDKRVDEAALVASLEDAGKQNALTEQRKARRVAMQAEATALRTAAHRDRQQAIALNTAAEEANNKAAGMEAQLAAAEALPAIIDTAAVVAQIAAAKGVNELIDRKASRAKLEIEAEALEAESDGLSATMEAREAAKQAAIAAAKLPVPGLGFGDGIIMLNGVPFDQASDAEQLRASIAIAMAADPKLRVIRVRDGSLLDDEAMGILGQMADKMNFQVWVERVDSSGKIGFVLSDGRVTKAEAAE